jgi:hypothetical protein
MTERIKILLCLGLTLLSLCVSGADTNISSTTITLGVPEVALLKANAGVINLTLAHQDAGMSVETSKSDSTARLLISSVVTSSARTLSAKISNGSTPAGTHLNLVALPPNANFVGTSGTLGSPITLDATDRPVITGIGSCYSGTGAYDGFPLKFTFALDLNPATYGSLRASTGIQVVVTLTLTASQ